MVEQIDVLQAGYCKALAHPTRIRILQLLRGGEKCVCEIYPALQTEQPNASRHLSILRKERIVVSRKKGLKVIYRVTDRRVYDLLDTVTDVLKEQWSEQEKILARLPAGERE